MGKIAKEAMRLQEMIFKLCDKSILSFGLSPRPWQRKTPAMSQGVRPDFCRLTEASGKIIAGTVPVITAIIMICELRNLIKPFKFLPRLNFY